MKIMIAIPVLCLAMNVGAECLVEKPRELPVIPDAAVATEQEMYQAQVSVQEYLQKGESYLECNYMNTRQHNRFVAQLEWVADEYNRELADYRSLNDLIADAK